MEMINSDTSASAARMLADKLKEYRAVLLCGISGSGKTTLARRIMEMADCHLLSVDALLWERYGLGFQKFDGEQQRKLTLDAEADIAARMTALLLDGERVIVDSCLCKRLKRSGMREAANAGGARALTVFLDAGYDLLSKRLAGRRGVSYDDIVITDEMLRRFCNGFERPVGEPDTIILDAATL